MTEENAFPPGDPARVLVVDDSPTALRLLQAIFESEHYDVVTARDGWEGLAKVHQCRPDLVITDCVMPGMDGFAFLRRLRSHPATDRIPVIMLTAEDPRHAPHHDDQLQPNAMVRKSADPEPLLKEVSEALKSRRQKS
jgi:CheY-like chemotaxis protein